MCVCDETGLSLSPGERLQGEEGKEGALASAVAATGTEQQPDDDSD